MNRRSFWVACFTLSALGLLSVLSQGCKGNLPPLSAMRGPATVTAVSKCVFLLNSCDSLTTMGNFTAGSANATLSISTTGLTQGTGALRVNLTTGGSSNIVNLANFYPGKWPDVAQIVMDVTADPGVVNGAFNQFQWVAQASSVSKWWAPITGVMDITAGTHSVTFNVDWTQGNMLPTDVMSNLVLVWNTGGTGTGNFYIDNIRLISADSNCPPPKPSTCGLVNGFESLTDNGAVTTVVGSPATVFLSTTHVTQGSACLGINLPTGGSNKLIHWTGFTPSNWQTMTQVVMDLDVDPTLIGAGYNQVQAVLEGNNGVTNNYWSPISSLVDVVSGSQSVTFNVDWTQGTMPSNWAVTGFILVWNTGGTGTGNFYVDNLRFRDSPSCP